MIKTTGEVLGIKRKLKIKNNIPQYTDDQRERLRKTVEHRRAAIIADKAQRHYLYLYRIITEKFPDRTRRDQFKVLVRQFGDTAVQEAVEYILMKNSGTWPVEAFFSYLLKMLQGQRDKENITLEEDSAEYMAKREKTIAKLYQAQRWRFME